MGAGKRRSVECHQALLRIVSMSEPMLQCGQGAIVRAQDAQLLHEIKAGVTAVVKYTLP